MGRAAVMAEVDLQVWVRDYAFTVRTVAFDCARALDAIPLSSLPDDADGFREGACEWGDDLFEESVRLGDVSYWDGPFDVRVTDEDAYALYLSTRRAAERTVGTMRARGRRGR